LAGSKKSVLLFHIITTLVEKVAIEIKGCLKTMYGLVNKALEQLVKTNFCDDTWSEITRRSGVDHSFVLMKPYPDHITYDLVAAASDVLDTPAEVLLESFGEHWIQYTVDEGYGKTVSLYGDSVGEFLQNMNNLHAQIRLSFPELRPPVISCESKPNGQIEVCYQSERAGLAPMLVGLIKGLGKRFSTPVDVEYLKPVDSNSDGEYFLVTFIQKQVA
jgi:hypothetical protein